MDVFDGILRRRLRDATRHKPRLYGQVSRPPGGENVGSVGGFYYEKRGGVFTAALPGQTIEQPDGRYLMALYPDEFPDARVGDEVAFPGARCRVMQIVDRGAYQTYRLEEIP